MDGGAGVSTRPLPDSRWRCRYRRHHSAALRSRGERLAGLAASLELGFEALDPSSSIRASCSTSTWLLLIGSRARLTSSSATNNGNVLMYASCDRKLPDKLGRRTTRARPWVEGERVRFMQPSKYRLAARLVREVRRPFGSFHPETSRPVAGEVDRIHLRRYCCNS